MYPKTKLMAVLFAAGLAAAPAVSLAATEFEVTIAPPADRVEVVPAPREGYVWQKGYWRYDNDGKRYNWADGQYIKGREGHRYIQGEWRHEGEKHRFTRGHWDND